MKTVIAFFLAACLAAPLISQQSGDVIWAPKAAQLTPYVSPNQPLTRLADVKAKHAGQTDWTADVVSDDHLHGAYVSMGPGQKTPRRMHPDTREWWVVTEGQIRFTIDGQEPFVASKGWLVQAPYRTWYTLETVGGSPSLRYEVNVAHAKYVYPADAPPPDMPGFNWLKVKLPQPRGVYDRGNKPYIDFNQAAANFEKLPKKNGQVRFINDDRAVSNVIYGYAKDLPPLNPDDKGHFHAECGEFWVILLGQIQYKIEGEPEFVASQGDIVYAPRMRWHRPRFYGDGPSCRLAMNGYPEIGHLFDAGPDGLQTTRRQ